MSGQGHQPMSCYPEVRHQGSGSLGAAQGRQLRLADTHHPAALPRALDRRGPRRCSRSHRAPAAGHLQAGGAASTRVWGHAADSAPASQPTNLPGHQSCASIGSAILVNLTCLIPPVVSLVVRVERHLQLGSRVGLLLVRRRRRRRRGHVGGGRRRLLRLESQYGQAPRPRLRHR
jgi:hypothetical protein